MIKTWDELKQAGSNHYKTGATEPIDLFRSARPCPQYNALDIKALTDIIKYAFRLLTRGYKKADTEKISHYLALYCVDKKEDE